MPPLPRLHIRTYTTPRRPTRILPPSTPLTLTHFLQRQRVLSLWRRILRSTNRISSLSTRKEMRDFARREFERNRGVSDLGHVRYLVSTGKAELERVERAVGVR